MIKHLMIVACISLSLPLFAETDEEKGKAISHEADKRDSGFIDFTASMTMELITRRGEVSRRSMRQKTLEISGDGDNAIIIFDLPKNIKGTALLTHSHIDDDDQWLYLPRRGRVKRIASTNKSGAFMGSEFAYEDMSSQEPGKYTNYLYLKDEMFDGELCFVIQRSPVDQDNSGYSRQVVWIDQSEYRVRKIDFYDIKKSHQKTLVFKEYEQYLGQFWRSKRFEMVNHITKKETKLLWSDFKFRVGLQAKDFRKKGLSRIR